MSRNKRIQHWHGVALLMMVYDMIAVNLSYFLALWFRFDCRFSEISEAYLMPFLNFVPVYCLICLSVFVAMQMYNSIWRFASYNELMRILAGSGLTSLVHTVLITLGLGLYPAAETVKRMPITYYVVGACLQVVFLVALRFSYRFILLLRGRGHSFKGGTKRVMLIGAGNAGQMIMHDASQLARQNLKICCIIDDNRNKWHRNIEGVPVVGGRFDILRNVEKFRIDKIFVAIPSADAANKREILNICKESGCEIKDLPGVAEIVNGNASISDMKDVAVEDLLGREPIRVDMEQIYNQITGKTILITGGGGSIGSELCRQVAAHAPKKLIIFDVYENNAYEIEQELKRKYADTLDLVALIGSVRDSRCLDSVFCKYKPDLVYHAAAHKHVPLMETSPCEAIKNNVIGTYKTAYAAMKHGCKRFVLISTDKAVNPTNIMGASKRLCEMVIQSFDSIIRSGDVSRLPRLFTHHEEGWSETLPEKVSTEFVAVRFGNVLGSNGSVIPLFKKQIASGGPVTVTHPDIIRYFMTIPEAVSLVMQAGGYARGGEIFVLDMGAPVKIDDLARNLIKLSGLKPDVDIPVVYTGLRPGEKLYEEKLMAEEGLQKTENALIHIGNPIPFDTDVFLQQLRRLMDAAYENDETICKVVADMVPTYHPQQAGQKDTVYENLRKEAATTH